ncbi:hypothetical protein [Haloarcula halophila]|nr:hypothetical protein [Halomicroarcula sp. DFY41]
MPVDNVERAWWSPGRTDVFGFGAEQSADSRSDHRPSEGQRGGTRDRFY